MNQTNITPQDNPWTVYILQCGDGSLYTGITTNMERRLQEHTDGKGAKYTRGRAPLKVIYTEIHPSKSTAAQREYHIKSLDRAAKLKIASQ